ncbi:MAG: twin-arginine translocation signal domain-containing protein [Ectothiorhodospiraceae bacterium]|nr:twin-arginine translocation signal domain-containing protein [Ectothiorhodospiraceae bacterium]
MSRQDDRELASRRRFLKTVAATGGAVAVTAAVGQAGSAMESEPETVQAGETTGYHETPHIRDYYARAEF